MKSKKESKMIWNRQTRYTPYNEWSDSKVADLKKQVQQSKWRMKHHIQPDSGLLNDPNGFSYFNGKWNLFYQVFPFGPVHGLKSWKHLTSKNLVDWEDEGLAIKPDTKYDSHGAYTGTSIPVNDKLFIMYTGNVRTKDWKRESYQLGAWMNRDNQIEKFSKPLIVNAPEGYTTSIRDPYIIQKNGKYFAIVGGQTNDNNGAALVYESDDLEDWNFNGELNLDDKITGYMVECPNLIFIDDKPVLIFCPQGLDKNELNYQNIYPNVYSVLDGIDLKDAKVENASHPQLLDDGFDAYATEAINAPDGRALAVSWIGLPEIDYPTDSENWAHCLSLIKELTMKDGHLYQNPVAEVKELRTAEVNLDGESEQIDLDRNNGSFETEMTVPANTKLNLKVANAKDDGYLELSIDTNKGEVKVDRSQTGNPFGEKFGQTRISSVKAHKSVKIRLVIDVSVFECYIDNGYSVMTGRFFLNDLPSVLKIENNSSDLKGTVWEWRK